MASNKLKVSLVVAAIFILSLAGFLFFVEHTTPTIQEFLPVRQDIKTKPQETTYISIDFGDGRIDSLEILFDDGSNLFQIMKGKFAEKEIKLFYENYSGLGEFITQIGNKKNGAENRYWQFWVNGIYAQIGASSYTVKSGDIIEWKFAPASL